MPDTHSLFPLILIRRAGLPVEALNLRHLHTPASAVEWQDAFAHNIEALQALSRNEALQRALLFSSHDLLERLPVFQTSDPHQLNKAGRKIALSLWQYAARAAAKTTPLSRFALVSFLNTATEKAELPDFLLETKAVLSPNSALLPAFYTALLQRPDFRHALKVQLNPALQLRNGRLLWWQYQIAEETECLREAEAGPVYTELIQLLAQGAIPYPDLLQALESWTELSRSEIEAWAEGLFEQGMLEWVWPVRGLESGWAGALYQLMGRIQGDPVFDATAFCLQWLRGAARTIGFQAIEEAMQTQRNVQAECARYFEQQCMEGPPVPATQVLLEDAERPTALPAPKEILHQWAADLRKIWEKGARNHPSGALQQAHVFSKAAALLQNGDSMPFPDFARAVLEMPHGTPGIVQPLPYQGPIGALLQVFQEENGEYKAVVNGLFAGGGKMFARWLHLTSGDALEQLRMRWMQLQDQDKQTIWCQFPFQSWSNANFQPSLAQFSLAVPGGRFANMPDSIRIADLQVCRENDFIFLKSPQSGKMVRTLELGLESIHEKTPIMQILWWLTHPYVSLRQCLEGLQKQRIGEGVIYMPRVERENLVLRRAEWEVEARVFKSWLRNSPEETFNSIHTAFNALQISSHFFAATDGERPQYFCRNIPVSMLLLEKMLHNTASTRLIITEMLPDPEQAGDYVTEIVMEF
jgi:hypothetical protein